MRGVDADRRHRCALTCGLTGAEVCELRSRTEFRVAGMKRKLHSKTQFCLQHGGRMGEDDCIICRVSNQAEAYTRLGTCYWCGETGLRAGCSIRGTRGVGTWFSFFICHPCHYAYKPCKVCAGPSIDGICKSMLPREHAPAPYEMGKSKRPRVVTAKEKVDEVPESLQLGRLQVDDQPLVVRFIEAKLQFCSKVPTELQARLRAAKSCSGTDVESVSKLGDGPTLRGQGVVVNENDWRLTRAKIAKKCAMQAVSTADRRDVRKVAEMDAPCVAQGVGTEWGAVWCGDGWVGDNVWGSALTEACKAKM